MEGNLTEKQKTQIPRVQSIIYLWPFGCDQEYWGEEQGKIDLLEKKEEENSGLSTYKKAFAISRRIRAYRLSRKTVPVYPEIRDRVSNRIHLRAKHPSPPPPPYGVSHPLVFTSQISYFGWFFFFPTRLILYLVLFSSFFRDLLHFFSVYFVKRFVMKKFGNFRFLCQIFRNDDGLKIFEGML